MRATMLTLAQAAAMTGMNRSSILRAIRRGALTGTKDHNGTWHVDGAELARVEERIKERLAEMRRERDRAQAGADAWKAQCELVTRQIALAAPTSAQADAGPLVRVWRWMRAG
jgi:hypothetical protein